MKFQIGRVIEYNGFFGTIITQNDTYVFLDIDINSNEKISNNDYVIFRGEKVNEENRAYFVKFFSKSLENFNDKDILQKIIMKGKKYESLS